ncbi:hypothetical protein BB560_001447, partial [Smittium megazygosporum]
NHSSTDSLFFSIYTLLKGPVRPENSPLLKFELQQTKSVAARNRTSDLPDSGRPDEPKGYNVKLFS